MKKIQEFLKNKSLSYYVVLADAFLALVLSIVFFLTYKGSMPNNAWGNVPETIGIFLLAGFFLEAVVLFLPQYKFIHIGALVMFGLSLMKEMIIIPNLIADFVNNVFFQGGSLPVNIFYIIIQFIIIISAVVVAFSSFYKDEVEEAKDFKNIKGQPEMIKLIVAGAAVLAVVLSSSITTAVMTKNAAIGGGGTDSETSSELPVFDPITEDIKATALAYDYSYNPDSVLIKEQATWDYTNPDLTALSTTSGTRADHFLVYYFEGSYAEGYQGDYSETYAYLYLWDDGLFAGKAKDTNIKGYWFNSSLSDGVDSEGIDVKDCLNMVSNVSNYDSIITSEISGGFYSRQAYIYLNMGWGNRSIIVNGYKYYPEVALFIDAHNNGQPLTYKVGDSFSTSSWTAKRVLKNLSYSSVFKASEVTWATPAGMVASGKLAAAGEYQITATWKGIQGTIAVTVTE